LKSINVTVYDKQYFPNQADLVLQRAFELYFQTSKCKQCPY